MANLLEELKALISALEDSNIDYALCGGLAMAVHGFYRTTIDIDVLIRPESLKDVKSIALNLGYTINAEPMVFAKGAVEIHRVSKLDLDLGDVLMLDLLLVTSQIEDAWNSRTEAEWENGKIKVVSRDGLIKLKLLRKNPQDIVDINRLKEIHHES
jgi:hypothetical protein